MKKKNKIKVKNVSKEQQEQTKQPINKLPRVENVDGIIVISQTASPEEENQSDFLPTETELDINKYTGIISVKSKNYPQQENLDFIDAPQHVIDQASAQQSQQAAELNRLENEKRAKEASAQPKIIKTKNNSVIAGFDTYDDIDINKIK